MPYNPPDTRDARLNAVAQVTEQANVRLPIYWQNDTFELTTDNFMDVLYTLRKMARHGIAADLPTSRQHLLAIQEICDRIVKIHNSELATEETPDYPPTIGA